ncbi:hypothetical protein HMPREF0602_1263 [Neisseria meningitidis ATCC 13091]|uniref:Uncharacterized protein n=1 Tax=Neisseria meningitidis serogroup B (strain ATCC 13091 / M2091) TaxID=862513 RepID=E0N9T3_NEIM3|nr:hypothetical protein HMPREF0602_1263 [Neisseria meningitidis ATCC 13091]
MTFCLNKCKKTVKQDWASAEYIKLEGTLDGSVCRMPCFADFVNF